MSFDYNLDFYFLDGSSGSSSGIRGTIMGTGIQGAEHMKAFDKVVEQRFDAIDFTPLLVYMIDTVPASALPHLATQFDVMGYKGWKYATTEDARRELIKGAIKLHRYKGTPGSIKDALKRAGFGGAEIEEGVGQVYDGTWLFNGTLTFSGLMNWACFRVLLDLGNDKGISDDQSADIVALVNEYKNVRSHLVDVSYKKTFEDAVIISDVFSMAMERSMVSNQFSGFIFDGGTPYDGSATYNAYAEEFTMVLN